MVEEHRNTGENVQSDEIVSGGRVKALEFRRNIVIEENYNYENLKF